jgi:hypothetical protein
MSSKNTLLRAANILKVWCVCAGGLFWACSDLQTMAGGIEGGNTVATIAGQITDTASVPLANVRVLLLPSSYDPVSGPAIPDSLTDTTDTAGHYSIRAAQTGSLNIEIAGINNGYRSLITGVSVPKKDTVLVQNAIARLPGAIKVTLPSTIDSTNGYLYIPGTSRYTLLSYTSGSVMLDSIPAGVSMSIYYAVRGSSASPQLVRGSMIVAPGGIMSIEYVEWGYSKRLVLNTTASGAGVAGTVTDFPVLVRLSDSNFTFSEAQQNGSDLRFTKSNGTPLAFEIERWDATSRLAEVWVKVDTIYGNDSSQYIEMYWGNPNVTSASDPAAVFATSSGFQGVWHLNEPIHVTVKDATQNHYDGTPSDTAPVSVPGAVGLAQSFDGVSNYIDMKGTASGALNFPVNGNYTISAWAYIDSFVPIVAGVNDHIDIVAKGNFQYHLQANGTYWQFAEFQDGVGWDITRGSAEARQWTYLAGVRKGMKQYLYADGICIDSAVVNNPGVVARDTTKDVCIGRFSSLPIYYFNGKIDEVCISSVSRSAEWEKLCYMNQKTADALVKF